MIARFGCQYSVPMRNVIFSRGEREREREEWKTINAVEYLFRDWLDA
jgi:hypothetical protein